MTCPLRQRGMGYCPRFEKFRNVKVNTPKPLRPQPLLSHGFFSMDYLKQHFMADERWTPESLAEQYKIMTDVISNHIVYQQHEKKSTRQILSGYNTKLQQQCHDGRVKLKKILTEDNKHTVRNFLINHKDLQRLYQNMPINMVVDNIDQRVFVMRRERDRLVFRLNQQKMKLKTKLVETASLENCLKFKLDLDEEEKVMSGIYLKKIENSKVRLKAINTIHNTYKRIINVLMHDEIFYEPILRSLTADMQDQINFTEHVIYLMPGLTKLKDLNEKYIKRQNHARKSLQYKALALSHLRFKKSLPTVGAGKKAGPVLPHADLKRYVRETQGMVMLKMELENIEKSIKEVKFVTLCSHAKEIYPRIKSQLDKNKMLNVLIEKDMMARDKFQTKLEYAAIHKGLLVDNLTNEEIRRLNRIKELKYLMKNENELEQNKLQHLKNRADLYVLVRLSLWNLAEIMRHVDRRKKFKAEPYPNIYLTLPFLKFEMFSLRASAPEVFECNIEDLMENIKIGLRKLLKGYKTVMTPQTIKDNVEEYHVAFLANSQIDESEDSDDDKSKVLSEDDIEHNNKILALVPNRKQIKAQSAKILEERSKAEDQFE